MELLKHDLEHEFPQYVEKMQGLTASDAHFSTLVGRYDAGNQTITRCEQGKEALGDEALEVLKKKRLELKDEIYLILKTG